MRSCFDNEEVAHGGRVHEFSKARGVAPDDVLDFSASINPLGSPNAVQDVLRRAETLVRYYPDSGQARVRGVLSRTFRVPEEAVWCGNGSTAVMDEIYEALKPTRTVVLTPAFSEYGRIASRHGSPVVTLPLEADFGLPVARIGEQLKAGDLLILNNPHNPSGVAWPRKSFEASLKEWTQRGAKVMVDEAFMDFLPDADRYTAIPLVQNGGVMVVRSATKIYAVPGLRFGFGVALPEMRAAVDQMRDPWSVNQIAQECACAAYEDHEFLKRTWHWLRTAQEQARQMWAGHSGVHAYPTRANYVLLAVGSSTVARTLADTLADDGILVRHYLGQPEPQSTWIRAALRLHPDNARLGERVRDILDRRGPPA